MSEYQEKVSKRSNYLEKNDYFMAMAFLAAKRSKDPVTQVGACIVDPNGIIVSLGYNGFPHGCSDDEFPWNKNNDDSLQAKFTYVCHAEVNAILNKNSTNVKGCTLYVAMFPCNECAKHIIQSGIKYVIYFSDKNANKIQVKASKRMLQATGVVYTQYKTKQLEICLKLSDDNNDNVDETDVDDLMKNVTTNLIKELTLQDTNDMKIDEKNEKLIKSTIINYKRTDYISWSDYFMGIAVLSAQRSKDPNTQVGACIVNKQQKIVGIGYNGFPIGCSDDEFPWNRDICPDEPLENKYLYVCHAEMNAIANKNCAHVIGCTIYVALFPCNECAKLIIQSGIKEVIYMSDKYSDLPLTKAAKKMFDSAGVSYLLYLPTVNQIILNFDSNTNETSENI